MNEIFRVFGYIGIDNKEAIEGLQGVEKQLKKTGEDFSSAGRTLTTGITAPIVAFGGAALASSISFESAFAGVRKTVDATEEEFAQFNREIRDLSLTVPASAEAIAAVAEAAGQLGIQNENIMSFTEIMLGLGEATNMSADQAATSLARFANIVQMPQESFDRLGSTIVELGNNLATTEGEIVEMGLRIAGAGNIVGLTEPQIMGFAGTLSSLGIEAAAGGTAISRVMLTMASDVMNGGESLDSFARTARMSADEFATAFRERPTEAIIAFVDGLAAINEEGGNVMEALDEVSLGEIRVRDALLRMAGSGDVLRDSLALATEAWDENIAVQEEVEQRYNTTESQMLMLRNAFIEVVRTLGDALVPMLRDAIEAAKPFIAVLQSMAEWFADLDPGIQRVITTIGLLVAAIGPLLFVMGSFAGAVSNLLPLFTRMVPLLSNGATLLRGLGAAFRVLLGPVGLVITAIGALVWAFQNDFLGIRTAVMGALDYIRENIGSWWNWVQTTFNNFLEMIRGVFTRFRQIFGDGIQAGLDFGRGIIDGFVGFLRTVFVDIPGRMGEIGRNIIDGLIGGITSMFASARDTISNFAGNIGGWFKSVLGISSPSTLFAEYGSNIVDGLVNGIIENERRATEASRQLAQETADIYKTYLDTIQAEAQLGVRSLESVRDELTLVRDSLKEQALAYYEAGESGSAAFVLLAQELQSVESRLEGVNREIAELTNNTDDFLRKSLIQAEYGLRPIIEVQEELTAIAANLRAEIEGMGPIQTAEDLEKLFDLEARLTAVNRTLESVANLTEEASDGIEDLGDAAEETAASTGGLAEGLEGFIGGVVNFGQRAAEAVTTFVGSAVERGGEAFEFLRANAEGLVDDADDATESVDHLTTAFQRNTTQADVLSDRYGGSSGVAYTVNMLTRGTTDLTSAMDALWNSGVVVTEDMLVYLEQKYKDTGDAAEETTEDVEELTEAIEEQGEEVEKSTSKLGSFAGQLASIGQSVPGVAGQVFTAASKIVDGIDMIIESGGTAEGVVAGLTMAFEGINSVLPTYSSEANQAVETTFGLIGGFAELITGIPGLGKAMSALGSLVSSVLGDMSNGAKQVREEITKLQQSFSLIDVSQIVTTTRVSRGGVLGWLGFTKEAIDEEATGLALSIAEKLEGVGQGLQNAMKRFLSGAIGPDGVLTELNSAVRGAIEDAIIQATLQGAIFKGALGGLLTDLTNAMAAGDDPSAILNQIKEALPGVRDLIVDTLTPVRDMLDETFGRTPEAPEPTAPAAAPPPAVGSSAHAGGATPPSPGTAPDAGGKEHLIADIEAATAGLRDEMFLAVEGVEAAGGHIEHLDGTLTGLRDTLDAEGALSKQWVLNFPGDIIIREEADIDRIAGELAQRMHDADRGM